MIWFALAFTLVVSGLAVRRLPFGEIAKLGGAWIAIFGALFVLVSAWQMLWG